MWSYMHSHFAHRAMLFRDSLEQVIISIALLLVGAIYLAGLVIRIQWR